MRAEQANTPDETKSAVAVATHKNNCAKFMKTVSAFVLTGSFYLPFTLAAVAADAQPATPAVVTNAPADIGKFNSRPIGDCAFRTAQKTVQNL
jgi:hypothetical protein